MLEKNLDDKDDPLTLNFMMVELDTKYKKICKKITVTQILKVRTNERKGKITMTVHLQWADINLLRADATYVKTWATGKTNIHLEEIIETCKTTEKSQICCLQTILQKQTTMPIQMILWATIPIILWATMYLLEEPDFKEGVTTVEN